MTKMVYAWREGRSASPYLSNVSPQVVGEELEKVREQGGGMIFPRAVIDHARPSDSPLHSCFEWNDTEAAEKFRIVQARGVIKSVEIVEIQGKPLPSPIVANVSVTRRAVVPGDPRIRYYESTPLALQDPELRDQVLQKALRELESWRERYDAFTEFSLVFGSIEAIQKKIRSSA